MINYNKLSKAAKLGKFNVDIKIEDGNDVRKLKHNGFIVSSLSKSKKFPKTCNVSWEHAKIKCEDIEILNENLYIYTLPEKLWIITQRAKQDS